MQVFASWSELQVPMRAMFAVNAGVAAAEQTVQALHTSDTTLSVV